MEFTWLRKFVFVMSKAHVLSGEWLILWCHLCNFCCFTFCWVFQWIFLLLPRSKNFHCKHQLIKGLSLATASFMKHPQTNCFELTCLMLTFILNTQSLAKILANAQSNCFNQVFRLVSRASFFKCHEARSCVFLVTTAVGYEGLISYNCQIQMKRTDADARY